MGQFVCCQLGHTTHSPESNVGSCLQWNGRIVGGLYISVVAIGYSVACKLVFITEHNVLYKHWCSTICCQKLLELFHSWVEELAHIGNGMDADLPDVKSALLAFIVCAFYRHNGKYFLSVCVKLFPIQTFPDVCNFRLCDF